LFRFDNYFNPNWNSRIGLPVFSTSIHSQHQFHPLKFADNILYWRTIQRPVFESVLYTNPHFGQKYYRTSSSKRNQRQTTLFSKSRKREETPPSPYYYQVDNLKYQNNDSLISQERDNDNEEEEEEDETYKKDAEKSIKYYPRKIPKVQFTPSVATSYLDQRIISNFNLDMRVVYLIILSYFKL